MTHTILWVFAGLYVLGAFATVAIIGKERKPVTNAAGAVSVLLAFAAVITVLMVTR